MTVSTLDGVGTATLLPMVAALGGLISTVAMEMELVTIVAVDVGRGVGGKVVMRTKKDNKINALHHKRLQDRSASKHF